MKTIYIVGGAMGVGKTSVCRVMQRGLENSVLLDGDWCWDPHPFQVTEETKKMVLENICFLLNQFISCSAYQNIVFCWVLHEQEIIDSILKNLNSTDCAIKNVSLICDETELKARLRKDIDNGLRTDDVIERSLSRISKYNSLDTIKIHTNGKSIKEVADEIIGIYN